MTPRRPLPRVLLLELCALALLLTLGAGTASASGGAWWVLNAGTAPTKLQPGKSAIVLATAVNAGYETIVGSEAEPVVVKDTLPEGFQLEQLNAAAGPEQPEKKLNRETHRVECTNEAGVLKKCAGQGLECVLEGRVIVCKWTGQLPGVESIRIQARGAMSGAAPAGETTTGVEASGGEGSANEEGLAAPKSLIHSVQISSEATPFGAEGYEIRPENAKGELDTQAGAHPFQLTSIFNLNQDLVMSAPTGFTPQSFPDAPALPKNLTFVLPPGLIGKAAGLPQCGGADFANTTTGGTNECPESSAIGYAEVAIFDPVIVGYLQGVVPVFNLQPEEGEPARFGFEFHKVPVVLSTRVRGGSDYGVEVSVHEASESAAVLSTQLTLWGVPNNPAHDHQRGWQCLIEGAWVNGEKKCEKATEIEAAQNKHLEEEKKPPRTGPEAFLSMPTNCASTAVTSASGKASNGDTFGLSGETPVTYEFFAEAGKAGHPFIGCENLAFEPSIEVKPDKTQEATPSGYTVTVAENQSGTVSGDEAETADAAIKSTTLTLPAGVFASAGAAQGLGTCTSKGFGFTGLEPVGAEAELPALLQNNEFNENQVSTTECPESSKIGTVDIETPQLDEKLEGYVYLSHEDTSPFTSPLALYIFAETPASKLAVEHGGEPKVQVKLAGEVQLLADGRLRSVFANTPPVQFSKLTLHLMDGPRASQSTPEKCGSSESNASFEASSGTVRLANSSFTISEGPGGGPCNPAFEPGAEAGADNGQAGAFSPFKVVIRKPDGENQLRSISVTEPPGAAAMLSSVTPCPTATAEQIAPETLPKRDEQSAAKCPESSQIGESVAVAGLGSASYGAGAARVTLPGKVYLTGPYHGAPFGLLDVTETEGHTGPFHLGDIGVMSKILVDENTAQATVTSNPLPQFVEGVPASIGEIVVDVNRPGFTFNPTNCSPLEVTGMLTGWGAAGVAEGAFPIKSPFHAANCASLPFKPTLSVELEPDVSRVDGTGLLVRVKAARGEANIHKTKLVFPTTIPSRLTTIQKACDDHIFNVNPANCPEGSVIGTAVAHTPVLKSPLVGPAYLVSHANASFPDAEFVLQGEGIKLVLDGKTDIKKGVTSSTFETVPDAPVETFEVKLPRGPHSAFSGFGDLCATPQKLPTELVGQNGVTISLTTKAKLVSSIDKPGGAVCGSKVVHKPETELQKLLKKCKKLKKRSKRVQCEATARKQVKAVASCKKKNKDHKAKLDSCIAKARKTYALKLR